MLALTKETDQSNQTKIQFVLAKAQHILLNNTAFEFDSQLDIQNQIQAIQSDYYSQISRNQRQHCRS
jgi:hypothetical protein